MYEVTVVLRFRNNFVRIFDMLAAALAFEDEMQFRSDVEDTFVIDTMTGMEVVS